MITDAYERVRDSLFFVPASIIAGLGVVSRLALAYDRSVAQDQAWLLRTTVDSARAILTTTATATITVAAIVFSMTAVVIQLATSQFSPRITQGFLRDRAQQATVGITVGTFVYSLLVLASVRGVSDSPANTYDLSATIAVALAVGSMVAIVSFIDRIMRNMRIDTIIASLATETERAVKALPEREPVEEESLVSPDTSTVTTVTSARTGWVRRLNVSGLLDALDGGQVVRMDLRAGDYVTSGESVATIWPDADAAIASKVLKAVEIDSTRSIASDPMYGIRQMVDVALRALSASLNDPTTAADVVHHLQGPLRAILQRQLPGRVISDDRGNRVYLPRVLTHSDYIHGALREIRLAAGDQPYVLAALLETLHSLIAGASEAGVPGRAHAAVAEADALITSIESSPLPPEDTLHLLEFAQRHGLGAAAG